NFGEITADDLAEGRNEWAAHKQFILADEVSAASKRALTEKIKHMVTQQTMRINKKYQPSYDVQDTLNIYLTSNHPNALYVDKYDRRLFVHEVTTGRKPAEFYKLYHKWMEGDGPAAVFHHLLNLDLSDFT